MTFAAAVAMKGARCTFACEMDRWIGDRKSLSGQTENPASVISSFVFESSVRKERPLWTKRAILTVGGLLRTTKAAVEESVLEGCNTGPRLTAWMAHHAAQVICACMVGAHGLTPCKRLKGQVRHPWQVSVNACGSETLFWKEPTSSVRDAQKRVDSASSRLATSLQTLTGGSAWSGRSREPTLTTDGKSCHQEILFRQPIWSQRQLSSHVREELGEKSILPQNVWRGIRSMPHRQIQIVIQFRGGCSSSRVTSWRTGRQIAVRVAEHWSVVVVHIATPRNVEFVSREKSGRQKRGKPVFVPQPADSVMLPRDVL